MWTGTWKVEEIARAGGCLSLPGGWSISTHTAPKYHSHRYRLGGDEVASYSYVYPSCSGAHTQMVPENGTASVCLRDMTVDGESVVLIPSTPFELRNRRAGPTLPGATHRRLWSRTLEHTNLLLAVVRGTEPPRYEWPGVYVSGGEPGVIPPPPLYLTASDGSYTFHSPGDREMGAGALHCVKDDRGAVTKVVRSMVHIPNSQSWPSGNAYLPWDPTPLSSFHAEAVGVLEAFSNNDMRNDTVLRTAQVVDNMALVTCLNQPTQTLRASTTHSELRAVAHDLKHQLATHEQRHTREITWHKAHNGDPYHDEADVLAKRASCRPQHYPPPLFPTSPRLFHLFFQHCLVVDDGRKHMRTVIDFHWRLKWKAYKRQGELHRVAEAHHAPLKRSQQKYRTRWGQLFLSQCVAGVLPMPVGLRKTQSIYSTPEALCPLCGVAEAGLRHLLTCAELEDCDSTLDRDMIDIVALPERDPTDTRYATCVFTAKYSYRRHPALGVPYAKLFPYDTDTPRRHLLDNAPLSIWKLPESAWYRHSSTRKHTVEVLHPLEPDSPLQPVAEAEFWRFVAEHRHTLSDVPLLDHQYAERAMDIHAQLRDLPVDGPSDALGYATPREVLRILVEETACEVELFSHSLNACYLFSRHCTDRMDAVAPFERSGMQANGLDEGWWVGSVYANPPYNNLIGRAQALAQRQALSTSGFRATFVIPLTEEHIHSYPHSQGRVLAAFPNGSFPFTPARCWRGEDPLPEVDWRPAPYRQANTRVAVVVYESDVLGDLAPLDLPSLQQRLATWFVGVAPRDCLTPHKLRATKIPFDMFMKRVTPPVHETFHREWMFWSQTAQKPNTLTEPYPGGMEDSYSIRGTPYANVVSHDPLLSMLGAQPALIEVFLEHQGHSPGKQVKAALEKIRQRLFLHIRQRWVAYQRKTHAARRDDGAG